MLYCLRLARNDPGTWFNNLNPSLVLVDGQESVSQWINNREDISGFLLFSCLCCWQLFLDVSIAPPVEPWVCGGDVLAAFADNKWSETRDVCCDSSYSAGRQTGCAKQNSLPSRKGKLCFPWCLGRWADEGLYRRASDWKHGLVDELLLMVGWMDIIDWW